MDRKPTLSIGDVLRQALESTEADRILRERQAIELWPQLMGTGMAELTSRPTVENGVMTIRVASAALRNDLTMNRSSIISEINRRLPQPTISHIRFISS